MKSNHQIKVLFVCMGNICRSPTAEGVFSSIVHTNNLDHVIKIDSAGTHAYHIGNPPDQRAQATAENNGVDLSNLVARKVLAQDFLDFDYIIAMDQDNLTNLKDVQKSLNVKGKASLHLFMEFAPNYSNNEVPDPYYGGANGFDEVFKMVKVASEGLLNKIVKDIKG